MLMGIYAEHSLKRRIYYSYQKGQTPSLSSSVDYVLTWAKYFSLKIFLLGRQKFKLGGQRVQNN